MSSKSVAAYHYPNAENDLKLCIEKINGKKVTKMALIASTCMERFPCGGHEGVKITYGDNSIDEYKCSSVSIGAIMTFYKSVYNVDVDNHCLSYINDEFKQHLTKTYGNV